MSKDETGSTENQGIPGFSANSSIPGGFTLPIPLAGSGAPEPEEAAADPWSSTWDDTSWHSDDTGDVSRAAGHTGAASRSGSSGTTNSWTDWEPSDPGVTEWSSTTTDEPAGTYTGWIPAGATLEEHASGNASDRPAAVSTDHSAAERAYAARPAVDPDV